MLIVVLMFMFLFYQILGVLAHILFNLLIVSWNKLHLTPLVHNFPMPQLKFPIWQGTNCTPHIERSLLMLVKRESTDLEE